MNLHPLTLILVLGLAFLFYSQGQVFFLFATLAIGFLLLVVSLTEPAAEKHEEKSHSLYPEKMEIKIAGNGHDKSDGQKELAESVGGFVNFTGNLLAWVLPTTKKEEKK